MANGQLDPIDTFIFLSENEHDIFPKKNGVVLAAGFLKSKLMICVDLLHELCIDKLNLKHYGTLAYVAKVAWFNFFTSMSTLEMFTLEELVPRFTV